jgi:Holliday junction DNA helicase RuvA
MIGSLRGRISAKAPPQLTVEVGGVGYELEAPMSTFFHLPPLNAEVRLLTHLVVREDAHVLYGFGTEEERRLFRSLIKVSGVGPKIALALLSGISVADFYQCVQTQDSAALTRVPGIGRKTAERLIVEMRDRLAAPELTAGAPGGVGAGNPETEAYAALVALGYRPAEATRLLKVAGTGTQSTEELIRRALQGAVREPT